MNNNLTLSDLQNKYRDTKAPAKKASQLSDAGMGVCSDDSLIKKRNSQPIDNQFEQTKSVKFTPEHFTEKRSSVKKPELQAVRNLKENKSKNQVKTRTLNTGQQHVNEGPIMAFLLFSGLAMLVGVMLLVTNNISATKSPRVLGQSTGSKSAANSQNSIVDDVQKSINSTNDKYQNESREIQNKADKETELNINAVEKEDIVKAEESAAENPVQTAGDEISVNAENIKVAEELPLPPINEEPVVLVRIKPNPQGGVNLRSEPNGVTKASALSGEEYELVGESGGWIEIKYSETENYWILGSLAERI